MTAVLTRPRAGVHQERDHAVRCTRCQRPTWEVHGVCAACGPVTCPVCAPDAGHASQQLVARVAVGITWFLLCLCLAIAVPGMVVVLGLVLLTVVFDLTVVPHRRGWWS